MLTTIKGNNLIHAILCKDINYVMITRRKKKSASKIKRLKFVFAHIYNSYFVFFTFVAMDSDRRST